MDLVDSFSKFYEIQSGHSAIYVVNSVQIEDIVLGIVIDENINYYQLSKFDNIPVQKQNNKIKVSLNTPKWVLLKVRNSLWHRAHFWENDANFKRLMPRC